MNGSYVSEQTTFTGDIELYLHYDAINDFFFFDITEIREKFPDKKVNEMGTLKINEDDENIIFIAGAKSGERGEFLTDGGRVINVVGLGKTLEEARKKAYDLLGRINFEGMYYRRDLGEDLLKYRD